MSKNENLDQGGHRIRRTRCRDDHWIENYGGDLNIHLDDDVNLDLDLDLTRTRIVDLHLDVDIDPILYGFFTGKDCGLAFG